MVAYRRRVYNVPIGQSSNAMPPIIAERQTMRSFSLPMKRLLRALPQLAASALLAAAGASLAASQPVTDEVLAPLTSAYVRAVKPGDQVELHRELFGTLLRRVHRSYAHEVDVPALVAAALKAIEPLDPQSGEPAEVFGTAINAALGSLDPH